jgi:single-strand DNA-binding protein
MANKVILKGHLGADPELKTFEANGGGSICTFSVATKDGFRDKESGEWNELTDWHRCKAKGKKAEAIAKSFAKGKEIYIEGKNKSRKWTDDYGNDHFEHYVHVEEFEFCGPKPNDS